MPARTRRQSSPEKTRTTTIAASSRIAPHYAGWPGRCPEDGAKRLVKKKAFFFEKKKQKTFGRCRGLMISV
jgi:hypothetical protein